MKTPTAVPHLTDLNKRASLSELRKELEILRKYRVYVTFDNAIERLVQEISRIEKE